MLAWDPYECERRRCALERVLHGGIVRQGACNYKKNRLIGPIGRIGLIGPMCLKYSFADFFLLSFTKFVQLFAQLRTAIGEDSYREEGRVGRAGLANRECSDRNPARHLDRGEERIESIQGVALHRHTQ